MNLISRACALFALALIHGLTPGNLTAQEEDFVGGEADFSATFRKGQGLEVGFPGSGYLFGFAGLAQPGVNLSRLDADTTLALGTYTRRAYLTFKASDLERGIDVLVRANYIASNPLLDAYINYAVNDWLSIRTGQFQNPSNNREMQFYEGHLAMPDRSLLSRTFVETGREFGLSLTGSFGSAESFMVEPSLAVTSGDGINSFGSLSNDPDKGGVKFGGRLDVYPFGQFDATSASDFERNETPKAVIGWATNYNMGASGPVGESHGEWLIFDENGQEQLPHYLKNHIDLLAKWKGASLLAEYTNAAAYQLDGAYTSASLGTLLMPTEISQYLMLGNAFNIQGGYLLKNGLQLDVRFGQTFPEFDQGSSLLEVIDAIGGCLTWHVAEHALKLQASAEYLNFQERPQANGWTAAFQTQFLF
ncbi:hypothetical protein N9L13_06300 [Flavobacteriales bacterium]|jgi:hypothetical protein|nr:hypothetical protein [Flavobacteriales bacterium]